MRCESNTKHQTTTKGNPPSTDFEAPVEVHMLGLSRFENSSAASRLGKRVGGGCQAHDFRSWYARFRVQGSGFRVQGPGFRVQGSKFRVLVVGCRV